MRKTIIVLLLCLALCWTGLVQAQAPDREIVVNIPGLTLYLYERGVVIKEYPISIGTELKPSQLGETTIINKVSDPTYYPPRWWERGLSPIPPGPNNPVGTRWLGLGFPSYGIHGTNNPDSIGTAASSGCIRMRNSDVEELAALVRVGTPVKLVYHTVLFGEDPMFGNKTITIYPDIYGQEVTRSQLEAGLKTRGWENVFWPALDLIVADAKGRAESLPLTVPLYFNGEPLEMLGVKVAGRYYVPYSGTALDNHELQEWGGKYYLNLQDYVSSIGLSYEATDEAIALRSPRAYLGERLLGDVLTIDEVAYIPVRSIGEVLDRQSDSLIPQQLTVISFQGDYYVPVQAIIQYDGDEELWIEAP